MRRIGICFGLFQLDEGAFVQVMALVYLVQCLIHTQPCGHVTSRKYAFDRIVWHHRQLITF